jgi:hypothetical protein
MNSKLGKLLLGAQILLLAIFIVAPLRAQSSPAVLSGTVTDPLGSPVPKAAVTLKNVFSGQEQEVTADSSGNYKFSNLTPGNYQISVAAEGYNNKAEQVTLAAGAKQKLDIPLIASSSTGAPSLSELGFPSSEVKGNPQEQALLNKRSHMLQIHQKLGLVTAGFMVAALATSTGAKGHHGMPGPASGRNLHMLLYLATAYYAIRAPKLPDIEVRGPIRLHKALAWIHGPGMIATTILGIMAYNQLSNGERVHGIAKYHSTAAIVTAAAFGGAILSVSVKF